MFTDRSALLRDNPTQRNYGVAVMDVDGDGAFEWVVAGYDGPNLILMWEGEALVNVADDVLADADRQAIGVAAGDIDGDGREELYVLNVDTFAGRKRFADRLFRANGDEWIDLFSQDDNQSVRNLTSGRSVACLDRHGTGRYGFFVANYGGPMRLYEWAEDGTLTDAAPEAGLDLTTGGRGVVALPLVSERMDLFAVNERGPNFLFANQGDGTFEEVAAKHSVSDRYEHGRGVDVLDTGNEHFGLVYGNWEGKHRLLTPQPGGAYKDETPEALAEPSRIRTVIAADFDNDGYEEIFFNNIGEPNRLFGWRDGHYAPIDIGEAEEPRGLGTGAAVADLDGDGRLELLVARGESGQQPLTFYHTPDNGHHYVRIAPRTRQGAPARGALVTLEAGGRTQRRSINAGSGYLCQMEPVAHFGLGTVDTVERVAVRWPDGTMHTIDAPAINQTHTVDHPG